MFHLKFYLFPSHVTRHLRLSLTPPTESTPETLGTEALTAEAVSQGDVSVVGETLEDMSLSSTSLSLDRNDTSQEYMDDFDNLGEGGTQKTDVNRDLWFCPDAPFPCSLVSPGSGEAGILLLSSKNDEDDSGLDQSCTRFDDEKVAVGGVTKAARFCFLDDGMEWAGAEGQEQRLTQRRRRSSQPEYHEQVLINQHPVLRAGPSARSGLSYL